MLTKFFQYTEIKTKITSTFTFAYTLAFLLYQGNKIDWLRTLLFFSAMFLFDLTTTAINNYIDTKDNGQILSFDRKTALFIIYILFILSTILGLSLAYLSDLVILAAGAVCFACGVFYTYGPIPISRQPLGELFSGFFYGFMIPFILLYINTPAGTFLNYDLTMTGLSLNLFFIPFLVLLIFSVIPFAVTANIMLANNICDLEKDVTVKRFTLPYYIGRSAIGLFAGLYLLTYVVNIIMVVIGIFPPVSLLALLSVIPVWKNIKIFIEKQSKEETFICSIKNFIWIMGTNSLFLFIGYLL